nr:immunoglobulin heavy chain junction region [Mus musculus]
CARARGYYRGWYFDVW